MKKEAIVSAPHGLLMIMGDPEAEIPEIRDEPVLGTSTSVLLKVMHATDGDVALTLGDEECVPDWSEGFNGIIATPSGSVFVFDTEWIKYAAIKVPTRATRVRILIEDPRTRNRVHVHVAPAES